MTCRALIVLLATVLTPLIAPSAGHAEAGNPVVNFTTRLLDAEGNPENDAGSHPDRLVIDIALDPSVANIKDIAFELPAGFAGRPNAVPSCPRQLLSLSNPGLCPAASQLGAAEFNVGFVLPAELYRTDPDPGTLAAVGFKLFYLGGRLTIKQLPNGQSLLELSDLGHDATFASMRIEMWGIPADHQAAPTAPRQAFLTLPTHCDGTPPAMKLHATSWQAPEVRHTMSADLGPPLVGCEGLDFDPRLDFGLDSTATDSPSGAQVTLNIPQNDDPDGAATAAVKDLQVSFPEGLTLSPGAANGLVACPEEAVGLGRLGPTSCPASSKIGAAELISPAFDDPVPGSIYIGPQLSATSYRMYLVMDGQGVDLKLAGTMHVDPQTGRIVADIGGIPEVAFERLTLSFGGGPYALFATALTCGSGTASVTLTPYDGGPAIAPAAAIATTADPFGRPCPASPPFTPEFVAGTSRPRAGAAAPLAATIRRAPGEELLDRFEMTLPAGMSAKLGSVPRCAATAVAAAACTPRSRVGGAIVEVGSGARPFQLKGDVFLTGPYHRAPFGMALVFGAVAGPFDLGTVVARAAVRIDPRSGQVTVETDPLPRMVGGVPLRIQTFALDFDRPGFIANPTSCVPSSIAAVIGGAGGAVSRAKSRFAVGGCRALRFRPTLSMALTDRSELRADGHPGVRLTLRAGPGGANLRDVDFELPKPLEPSMTGSTAICSLAQLDRDRCPAAAIIGKVSGRTPLLPRPLKGPVYSVQPPGNGIADTWAVMRGMGVTVRIRLKNSFKGGHMRGKLVGLPDIPLSRLTVAFASGEHGMFSTGRDLCVRGRVRRLHSNARLKAHNAATRRAKVRIRVAPGC
jgi:hypothetical protein